MRQLYELDDFAPSESIERFREIGVGNGLLKEYIMHKQIFVNLPVKA